MFCDKSPLTVITLTITAFNDVPADGTLQVHFDELGGTIGRADSNQLVLPDPDRVISRVAAQVVFRNGAFAIVDRGSNPIRLNGVALASGREAPLVAGDALRIGGYDIKVSLGGGSTLAAASDPFADLLGPTPAKRAPGQPLVDPLSRNAFSAPPPMPPEVPHGIPTDWDPFASKHGSGPVAAQRPDANALGLDLGSAAPGALIPELGSSPAGSSSLDQMFGLTPSSGKDPLADSVLDAPMAQPNMAADADPLRSLGSAPRANAAALADQVSDLQRPFIPPTMLGSSPQGMVAPPLADAVMSWDVENRAGHAVIQAKAPLPAAAALPPAEIRMQVPAAPSSMTHSADQTALLEALRRGLNAPALDLPALTPALMELIGQVLHEAARGTVDLLGSRATVKRGLGAEATTIVPRHNNPLKFSPNAEVALQHLLSPPARGFIAAAPAMRDAFNDLRAHQFGVVAGMQAALEATMQRFDPAHAEAQLTKPSLLQGLLPVARKAHLWDLFTAHFARVRDSARDDVNSLGADAFHKAYDEHVKRLLAKLGNEKSEGQP